ncbi:MAG TPA: hypothetical protein VMJ10_25375 [Kofleriaceae bacterium]|nr:hypothetical protein [Kofleriaceae bacterium]
MRLLRFACFAVVVGCSNSPSPRLIAGGGIGDGSIDGTLNVYVIDHDTEAAISGATVEVGTTQKTTDAKGLAVFSVSGKQTVTVSATGYVATVWADVDGANVTVPVNPTPDTPDQATLSGTIASWSSITVPAQHVKAGYVLYSSDTKANNGANSIATPGAGQLCGVAPTDTMCSWSVATRTGNVTLTAVLVDVDTKGTVTGTDDTRSIIGYATTAAVTVDANVNQTGIVLDQVDAGDLEDVTIDTGTPPAALTTLGFEVGVELDNFEVVELPVSALSTDYSTVLVPKPTVYAADADFRLTGSASTTSNPTAQSIIQRTKQTSTALAAGTWLDPPTNATITTTNATFDPVAGASAHTVKWTNATGDDVLDVTIFDPTDTSFDVPNLVALPSGTLTATVQGIAATFPVNNFSLDDDLDELWGVSSQPATVGQ